MDPVLSDVFFAWFYGIVKWVLPLTILFKLLAFFARSMPFFNRDASI